MALSRKKFFTAIRTMAVSQIETMAVVMMQAMVKMANRPLGLGLARASRETFGRLRSEGSSSSWCLSGISIAPLMR